MQVVPLDTCCASGFRLSPTDTGCPLGFRLFPWTHLSLWMHAVPMDTHSPDGYMLSLWIHTVPLDTYCPYGYMLSPWIQFVLMNTCCPPCIHAVPIQFVPMDTCCPPGCTLSPWMLSPWHRLIPGCRLSACISPLPHPSEGVGVLCPCPHRVISWDGLCGTQEMNSH